MSQTDQCEELMRLANRAASYLRDVPGTKKLFVFGSVSKGSASESSDVDICAVFSHQSHPTQYRNMCLDTLEDVARMSVGRGGGQIHLHILPDNYIADPESRAHLNDIEGEMTSQYSILNVLSGKEL